MGGSNKIYDYGTLPRYVGAIYSRLYAEIDPNSKTPEPYRRQFPQVVLKLPGQPEYAIPGR